MKKLLVLVVTVSILLIVGPDRVIAQEGDCPAFFNDMGTIHGTYPGNAKICMDADEGEAYYWIRVDNDNYDYYPCNQHIAVSLEVGSVIDIDELPPIVMAVVPPADATYEGNQIRVRFYVIDGNGLRPKEVSEDTFHLDYYDQSGLFLGRETHNLSDYPVIQTTSGTMITEYYNVYVVDEVVSLSGSPNGGFVKIILNVTPDSFSIPLIGVDLQLLDTYRFVAIQIGDDLPAQCEIPNYGFPPTPTIAPTPTGTLTPTPTATATPTGTYSTPTPYPTSIGGTITPIPTVTPTPITFATIPAENTPTPWPPYIIPTVRWPTPYPTIIGATVAAIRPTKEAAADSIIQAAEDIKNSWGTPRAQAQQYTDPNNSGYITTTTESGTIITDYVSVPFGYLRGIHDLIPNAWLFVSWAFVLVGIVLFSRTAKFWLGVVKAFIYVITLIWGLLVDVYNAIMELIPF